MRGALAVPAIFPTLPMHVPPPRSPMMPPAAGEESAEAVVQYARLSATVPLAAGEQPEGFFVGYDSVTGLEVYVRQRAPLALAEGLILV